jgi:hypothetical protein
MIGDMFTDLKNEVSEIRERHPFLSPDNAFVVWFLRAFIVEDEKVAVGALRGGSRDKGVDAVYIDHDARTVFLLQAKYHQGAKAVNEKRSDVIALADLGRTILEENKNTFKALLNNADATVKHALEESRDAFHRRGYRLTLQFVTTGSISATHKGEAERKVYDWEDASFEVFSRRDLVRLHKDYMEGAAPPLPTIVLRIQGEEVFKRDDRDSGITSWIFTMAGRDVGKLFNDVGVRLFARNIRGFLGTTEVNRGMQATLKDDPAYFWYFNNGVTIVCDRAEQISRARTNQLRVTNAQIINGQQTTRTLASYNGNAAEVLVKLVEIPRDSGDGHSKYSHVVSEIVSATNWQNAISQSDLKANDVEQVRIEREMRKLNYQYLRKRMNKAEARRISGGRYGWIIKKEDLARSVGACVLDPYEVRLGKDRLFEDDVYYKIFNGRLAAEYLTFFWLDRLVSYMARHDSRRGYARWLVLNFIWSQLAEHLRRKEIREKFRYMAERGKRYELQFTPLYAMADMIFVGVLAYYRANKRRDGKLQDESSFFKHKGLHKEFELFWNKQMKGKHEQFQRRLDALIDRIRSVNE